MIQDIYPDKLSIEYIPDAEVSPQDYIIMMDGRTVGLKDGRLPTAAEVSLSEKPQYLFMIDDRRVFFADQKDDSLDYSSIRGVAGNSPIGMVVFTGIHLANWYRSHRYCGKCGRKMIPYDRERALICECCGNIVYPVIMPAVIVAVTDGDRIVMTQYAGREYTHYALIAGFCEIGESAEDTVRREVMEEVGLKVRNIRYFASQPWGINSNLLLGYFCEVDGSRDIRMDENELSRAVWMSREEMEERTDLSSLTSTMMMAFKKGLYE